MKLLVTVSLDKEKLESLKNLGYEVIYAREGRLDTKGESYEVVGGELGGREDVYEADAIYTYMGFSELDISKMKNLKFIQTTSTGFDQVPVDYVEKNNIFLSNNTTGYAIPIAESTVMYILEAYKNSRKMFRQQDEKVWKMDMSWLELSGKRVGFLGTGNISKEAAKRLKSFDVEIWGVNTNGRDVDNFDRCFPIDDSDEFFKSCDVVIGLMPATEKTTKIINKSKFELMKDGSIFMNIGRGNLVDQDDLEVYLDKFRAVVLDVAEFEPIPEDSPLWDADNVIITPHNSWVSEKNQERLWERVYENLSEFIRSGKPKTYIENVKKGY